MTANSSNSVIVIVCKVRTVFPYNRFNLVNNLKMSKIAIFCHLSWFLLFKLFQLRRKMTFLAHIEHVVGLPLLPHAFVNCNTGNFQCLFDTIHSFSFILQRATCRRITHGKLPKQKTYKFKYFYLKMTVDISDDSNLEALFT